MGKWSPRVLGRVWLGLGSPQGELGERDLLRPGAAVLQAAMQRGKTAWPVCSEANPRGVSRAPLLLAVLQQEASDPFKKPGSARPSCDPASPVGARGSGWPGL